MSTQGKEKSCFFAKKWNWIQKYHPRKVFSNKKRISEYIVDETLLKVGSEYVWLWVAIEPENRHILAVTVSRERNMLIAERFLSSAVKVYGIHTVSTDGGTWYPMACKFLKLDHHIHSFFGKEEKSLIERTMQYIKDRTECFDDYFPCKKIGCKLKHVRNWLNLFVNRHNEEMICLS
ncbi:MAG: DDE-type integrase/transposase/recombinase [Sphingobacterium sp.]